jgi:hypothetical protein
VIRAYYYYYYHHHHHHHHHHNIHLEKTGDISENLIKTYFIAAITLMYAPEYKV